MGIKEGKMTKKMYTVKKGGLRVSRPSRDVTTKLSLGGNNDVITELFPPRGSLVSEIPAGDGKLLVSDIPAGDGKLVNLFNGVNKKIVEDMEKNMGRI